MIVLNGNAEAKKLDLARFSQFLKNKQKLNSAINAGVEMPIPNLLELKGFEAEIFKIF
jgi:hypothetical protein